jgi:hypothetical protein
LFVSAALSFFLFNSSFWHCTLVGHIVPSRVFLHFRKRGSFRFTVLRPFHTSTYLAPKIHSRISYVIVLCTLLSLYKLLSCLAYLGMTTHLWFSRFSDYFLIPLSSLWLNIYFVYCYLLIRIRTWVHRTTAISSI